ncbi:MAG: ImmA/IrrE family metallo-endopeptidase [Thermoanaerobaculia bacterium]
MNDREAVTWAEKFWRLAGQNEPFPRSLEASIPWALPLVLVKLPRLGLLDVRLWLEQRGIPLQCSACDRALEACLVARGGHGLIFLDGADPPDVQRFALAHEIAHFLIDYLGQRQRALERLGERILAVLDGCRPATKEERLSGVLRGVALGTFTHLMDRSAAGDVERLEVLAAEDRADRVALELLAPHRVVVDRLKALGVRWRDPSAVLTVEEFLVQEFGLPVATARSYGRLLIMSRRSPCSFQEWMRPVEDSDADGKR